MPTIKIKPTLRLSDFDRYAQEIYSYPSETEKLNIQLPNQLTKSFFAVTVSLIQLIAGWLRSEIHGDLLVDLTDDQNAISKMYEEEFFFPIIALAWNDVRILNLQGINMRPLLRDHQNDFILKMRKIAPLKGEKLLLVNLDHFDNNTGVLPFFETRNQGPTSEISLLDSLRIPIINGVLKNSRESKIEFLSIFNQMGAIIYELMKNTFEWAKTNEQGLPLSPNIRGLYIRLYKKSLSVLLEEYEKDIPIYQYFSDETVLQTNDAGQLYFVEISVFDSGVGFVRKFKDEVAENLDDISIIKKCLLKNQTSSSSIFKEKKGIGLDRILYTLNNKGFLRIKTDKYCLYRNMIESPYQELIPAEFAKVELKDWYNQNATEFSSIPFASGTTISILYPISIKSNIK